MAYSNSISPNIFIKYLYTLIFNTHVSYTHTNIIHHTNVLSTIIHPNFPQVMDSQMNSELLDKVLDEEIIFFSGSESEHDLFGNDEFDSIIKKLFDILPTHKNQLYTKTTMTTISSNVTHQPTYHTAYPLLQCTLL